MKKCIIITSVLLLCISVCGCGTSGTKTIEDKIKEAVDTKIEVTLALGSNIGPASVTHNIEKVGENQYEVMGTISSAYQGFSYAGTYDADVEYLPGSDRCTAQVNIHQIYKEKLN